MCFDDPLRGPAPMSGLPSAARVTGPAWPSALSPSYFWYAITAANVALLYSPSTGPGRKPISASRCCTSATIGPFAPWRSTSGGGAVVVVVGATVVVVVVGATVVVLDAPVVLDPCEPFEPFDPF